MAIELIVSLVSVLAGIAIIVFPSLLRLIVGLYLILGGLFGLFWYVL